MNAISHLALPGWPRALHEDWAAAYVSLSTATMRRMIEAGTFPKSVAVSASRRAWMKEDLDLWLDGRKSGVAALSDAEILMNG